MIIAIGNAPSSGSTLLADLMDSLPFAVCGPELNLFSLNKYFSDFEKVKQDHSLSSQSAMIYQGRQRLLTEYLQDFGITEKKINEIYDHSATFADFCHKIFEAFSKFRGKDGQVFIEKTPQNIHCAKSFLDTFEDGYFLHIVRNPLFVYKSLIRRNLPPYIAANAWLIDVSRAFQLRNHPRLLEIKYESMVEKPFEVINSILMQIGLNYPPDKIEALYKGNKYREKHCTKINTWSISQYGIIGNANQKEITDKDLEALNYMMQTKISDRYACLFELEPVGFNDLIGHYGYSYKNLISGANKAPACKLYNIRALRGLLIRYIADLKCGECRVSDLLTYLRPVEIEKCAAYQEL